MRYLGSQIRYVCGETSSLPTVPSQLMESFTDSLERLSVAKVEKGGMAVIVIDGADLVKVGFLCYVLVSVMRYIHRKAR